MRRYTMSPVYIFLNFFGGVMRAKVGRCRLTVSKPALKAPVVSALDTII
jgi:hypothetical protein